MSGLFVYALVDGCAPLTTRGVGGERLRLVPLGRLTAAVGDLRSPPRATPRAARAYDAVLRRLARRCASVLPARFGSSVDDEETLRDLLAPHSAELRRAIARVRGRVQMTLRVYGPREDAAAPAAPGPGARHLRRLARPPQLVALRRILGGLVRAERIERHARPPLLASVYHLIDRGDEDAYLDALRRAAGAIAPVRVAPSGPWPSYAFGPEALL